MTAATTAEHGLAVAALRRRAAAFGLLAVLVAALVAAVPGGAGALDRAREVSPAWIAVAVAFELASEVGYVVIFRHFFDCLPGRDARALAWTELGSGVLLPGGGAGGLAIGGWLMHLAGVPAGWVVRRSAGLFLLNAAVSGVALIGAGVALIAMLVVATLPATVRSRPHAPRVLRAIATGVREAQDITLRDRSWRVAGAVAYLVFDMAVLWVALRALGDPPSVPALMMAYSVGYLAAALPVLARPTGHRSARERKVDAQRRPPAGGLSKVSFPPRASTRSVSPTRPDPPAGLAPPTPSSCTETRRSPLSTSASILTNDACACLAAFVSASATT
jgi:hypothetical protein